jgi:hypothetical protein
MEERGREQQNGRKAVDCEYTWPFASLTSAEKSDLLFLASRSALCDPNASSP